MKYKCKVCKYETDRKSSFDRHNESQKHIIINRLKGGKQKQKQKQNIIESGNENERVKVKINYPCMSCGTQFAFASGLSKHRKFCKMAMEHEKNPQEVNELKDEIITLLREQNLKTEKNEAFLKKLLENAGSVAHKQMSAINYIMQKFPHAPELKQIENFAALTNENDLVKTLIYHFDIKNIVSYLGDFIIEYYKDEQDPNNQSIWNSDTHRLTYIIRTSVGGQLDWHVDKDAVKLIDIIIHPILTTLRKEIYDRVKATSPATAGYVAFQTSAAKIIKSIDDDSLAKELARYIAPKFQVIKL